MGRRRIRWHRIFGNFSYDRIEQHPACCLVAFSKTFFSFFFFLTVKQITNTLCLSESLLGGFINFLSIVWLPNVWFGILINYSCLQLKHASLSLSPFLCFVMLHSLLFPSQTAVFLMIKKYLHRIWSKDIVNIKENTRQQHLTTKSTKSCSCKRFYDHYLFYF